MLARGAGPEGAWNTLLKDHLIEDLLRLHALEHGRNVLAARDLSKIGS